VDVISGSGDVLLVNVDSSGELMLTSDLPQTQSILSSQVGLSVVGGFLHQIGGSILSTNIINGDIRTTNGFDSSVYISLFGGNLQDNSIPGNDLSWWGNLTESDPNMVTVSRTQHLLRSSAISPGLLPSLEIAIRNDLAWIDGEIDISLFLPSVNMVQITIEFNGLVFSFQSSGAA